MQVEGESYSKVLSIPGIYMEQSQANLLVQI
jgi:hypothetical protein